MNYVLFRKYGNVVNKCGNITANVGVIIFCIDERLKVSETSPRFLFLY